MKGILIICTIVSSHLFASAQESNYFKPEYSTVIKGEKSKRALNPPSRQRPNNVTGYWDITEAYIKKLETNFKKILLLKSPDEYHLVSLEIYAYQYTGFIMNDKKYIYISAFGNKQGTNPEHRHSNWKNDPIATRDGGTSYWGAIFSIDDLEFSQLNFNGSA